MVVRIQRSPGTGDVAELFVEHAHLHDVSEIRALIEPFAARDEMLPRSFSELYESIREYWVVRRNGEIVGCGALHVLWHDLAEVRGLAVRETLQGGGVGRKLVQACLEEAQALGIRTVFALTLTPGFFERLGFTTVDITTLPQKVWGECYRCPKFNRCNEIAMVRRLDVPPAPADAPEFDPELATTIVLRQIQVPRPGGQRID